jgi:hypothetical protein
VLVVEVVEVLDVDVEVVEVDVEVVSGRVLVVVVMDVELDVDDDEVEVLVVEVVEVVVEVVEVLVLVVVSTVVVGATVGISQVVGRHDSPAASKQAACAPLKLTLHSVLTMSQLSICDPRIASNSVDEQSHVGSQTL